MTERADLANLRALGEPRIHDWAGASEPIGAGLVEWTRLAIAHDQRLAVRASLGACALVTGAYPATGTQAPRQYIDRMVAAISRWLEEPSKEHREAVRSSLDVDRQAHAWQTEDAADFWILEAVDHASLAVWAGERSSYIVPLDYTTCAARSIACVLHAMLLEKWTEAQAIDTLTGVVAG